ncbi:MAG TPA: hypothetical protein VG165_01585 [Solirubrobacteraceae bacterium]|jgi:hypothetical protein|nr:hypothetical protein [Solirubrobacteraceae bacterium]
MRRLTLLLGLCGLLVTGVLTASASALGLPPVVTTGTATAPTQTATTLSGTVTPVGLATTYQFDYGTTTSYGMSTTPTSAGSGIAAVPVTANLTGLTPATTYHFRLEATNTSSATPTDGLDGTFTTAGSPVVVTGAATGVTGTTATLGGTVNPSGIAATYVFQYGTTAAYGQQTAAQAAGAGTTAMTASAALTGLAPGTTYHYRLAATNAYTTVPGADATFVTPGAAGASKLSVAVNPAGGNTDLSSTLTIGTDAAGTPGGAATSITQAISSQFANQLASFGTCATSAFENVGGPTSAACTDRSSILGTGTIVTHPQTGTDVASDQGFIVKTAANTVVFWWHTPALGATPASFGAAPGTVSQTTGTYGPIVTYDLSGLPAGTRLKSLTLDYQASAVNGKAPFAASTCVGGSWAFETGILYAGGVTPELPTATVPCGVAAPPQPAKLQVSRATISKSARTIDILAPITHRATGSVKLDLFAAGQHYDWTAAIDSADGRIRTTHSIPVAQADKGTGILTITYAGNAATRPQVVRLRAADVPANLDASRPTYAAGVLHDQGTISSLARGIVRVQLQYFSGGTTTTLEFHAPISNGTWSLNTTLTAAQQTAIAARSGTLHSYILFTGYLPQRMRGEMNSYQVLGAP